MRKVVFGTSVVITMILAFAIVTKVIDYSITSRNTRLVKSILLQTSTPMKDKTSGQVEDLITIDYDKMFVFEPYQSMDQMEKQIGFKCTKLREGLSEGIINILFVKDDSAVAYLFGYAEVTGYYIDIPYGEYTKARIDSMSYKVEQKEAGNSADTPKTYKYYKFEE